MRGRGLGFAGKTAIHPAQVPVIHEVFTPSREEVERARAIVEADRGVGGSAVGVGGGWWTVRWWKPRGGFFNGRGRPGVWKGSRMGWGDDGGSAAGGGASTRRGPVAWTGRYHAGDFG